MSGFFIQIIFHVKLSNLNKMTYIVFSFLPEKKVRNTHRLRYIHGIPNDNQLFFYPINHYFTMKNLIFLVTLLLAYTTVNAQPTPRIANYEYQKGTPSPTGTPYTFSIEDEPALLPTYGKEDKARFEYYLEFGDGEYTRIEDGSQTVNHIYTINGRHETLMRVTGIYDDGDDPDARMINPLPPNGHNNRISSQPTKSENIIGDGNIEMEIHRSVNSIRPEEENIIILKYRNRQPTVQSGKLLLFYNEKGRGETKRDDVQQFDLMGQPRIYHQAKDFVQESYQVSGETKNLSAQQLNALFPNNNNAKRRVIEAKERFGNYLLFNFDRLAPSRQSHIFISLKTDKNIGDINGKEVFVDAVFASNTGISESTTLELEVNMARDPNAISVSEVRESFRRVQDKKLTYTVKFQNEADAPAKHVFVSIEIPKGLEVDKVKHIKNSFNVKRCTDKKDVPCYDIDTSEEDSIKFSFMRVSLPGFNDPEVKKYKETVGSFKYEITYKDKLKKQPLSTRAHIKFKDDVKTQSAVTTNLTTTRFKPGLSIGPRIGVDYNATDSQPSYFIGAVASPYKSERFYYQPEIMLRYSRFECDHDGEGIDRDRCRLMNESSNFEIEGPYEEMDSGGNFQVFRDTITSNNSEWKVSSNSFIVNIVPLQIRKDIGKVLSFGTGTDIGIVFRKNKFFRDTSIETFKYIRLDNDVWDLYNNFGIYSYEYTDENDIYIDASLFFDVTVGSVKAGPALSIRYLREFLPLSPKNIEAINSSRLSNKNRLQASLLWKF